MPAFLPPPRCSNRDSTAIESPAKLHSMPEDFSTPPPPPPSFPYTQTPAYPPAYPYPPRQGFPPPRQRSAWFYIGIIAGSLAAVFLLVTFMVWITARSVTGSSAGLGLASNSIAVIDISGAILSPETIDSQLRKFGDDSSVKAILLHINSPGGGAAASQEIYHEVLRVRQENHKKVIASIESVGASGAYYIASACDRIYANDASVVGSIGVIMEWTNYGDLLRWAKLKNVVIHAGELKDAGDPSRDLTPKEQAYFQSLVDNMYTQFVHDVATGRHTSDEKIKPLATGQVWTGQQSLPLGLIDKVGGYRVALMETAREAGISGEPNVVRPAKNKRGLFALLADDGEDLFPNPSQMLNHAPGFYFMWK
ncbi:signal peptide peptidase SppA [Tunturiibacter empetritectus]|uniref:Protease-4 n=2 Tax=Tunturiibacter empetritectus TaxID=3069691 RepID=A0A7W8MTD1_9BACT|nr:protease-4 [Edaphobacter lichenicola]